MTEPLKVLIVSSHLKTMGGAEKNLLELSAALNGRCHVEVAAMQSGPVLDAVRAAGVTAHDLNVRALLSVAALRKGAWLRRKLVREKFDVVLTYHHDADIWAGLVAASAGVAVVSSRRDLGFQLSGAHVLLYRLFNRLFRRIIVVSGAVGQEIVRTQGAPRDRIVVVHNGLRIPADHVDADAARRDLGLEPGRLLVGTVANFRPIKGQEFFVQAAAEVAHHRDDVDFVVVGSKTSDYYQTVEKMIRDLGLAHRFFCAGERADVARILPAFDVFVLSSRQEGFSNALVEAMAAGVPAVASAVGGNPEAVEHGRTGFLFPVGDARAMARHLLTLLGDDDLRGRMGAAAGAAVRARFSFEAMIDKVYDALLDAVGGERARAFERREELT